MSTADGLLLTIANGISHDLYYKVINPQATLVRRLTITKIFLIVTALIAAYVATFRLAIIVELVAWAFSLAGASFFPALVMGIWWKRTNKAGALAGMVAGLAVTLFYMVGSRFYGMTWFGTATVASASRSGASPKTCGWRSTILRCTASMTSPSAKRCSDCAREARNTIW